MFSDTPLHLSRWLLDMLGIQTSVYFKGRVPTTGSVLVVSNHRSFLDAPLLITAVNRSVRFACHHYMSQTPILREFVTSLGCFPLDPPGQRHNRFFQQAIDLLQSKQAVGIFPEGAGPMIQATQPGELSQFHRGFAHLALRAPVQDLAILPVAIASTEEYHSLIAPLKLFKLFDPSEPLFDQPGWHPAITYRRVNVLIGHPIWITDTQRQHYQGKQAGILAKELTQSCYNEIAELLHHSCY